MAYYMVRYTLGADNHYDYPASVAGVVWKSAVYHYTEHVMVGETDAKVEADGKQVIALNSDKAKQLTKQYQASYPKSPKLPDLPHLPRK